eukprot:53525-Eustigmatos_ZCMA.PRE.2
MRAYSNPYRARPGCGRVQVWQLYSAWRGIHVHTRPPPLPFYSDNCSCPSFVVGSAADVEIAYLRRGERQSSSGAGS